MPLDSGFQDFAERFHKDGYLSPVRFFTGDEAAAHRAALEAAEAKAGPLHYRPKIHTVMRSPFAIATDERVLDAVEALIGPDILLHNVTYIVKEPASDAHVSWHQDLTFWGFSGDDLVTLWVALSPATEESGCMRMVPGSHRLGRQDHDLTADKTNVLLQGQTVRDVAEESAVMCPLEPGEASFHHGWNLHASMPNRSADRRIGLNIQYLATHLRQTKHQADSAVLVRGEDRYGNFGRDIPAAADLEPDALARLERLEKLYKETAGTE